MNVDADVLPARSPPRGVIAIALRATANSPGCSAVAPLRVAEVVEPGDQLLLGERLAAPELDRPGVDARQRALALAVQPCVDEARRTRGSST